MQKTSLTDSQPFLNSPWLPKFGGALPERFGLVTLPEGLVSSPMVWWPDLKNIASCSEFSDAGPLLSGLPCYTRLMEAIGYNIIGMIWLYAWMMVPRCIYGLGWEVLFLPPFAPLPSRGVEPPRRVNQLQDSFTWSVGPWSACEGLCGKGPLGRRPLPQKRWKELKERVLKSLQVPIIRIHLRIHSSVWLPLGSKICRAKPLEVLQTLTVGYRWHFFWKFHRFD